MYLRESPKNWHIPPIAKSYLKQILKKMVKLRISSNCTRYQIDFSNPPSIGILAPVMYAALSDAKKAAK